MWKRAAEPEREHQKKKTKLTTSHKSVSKQQLTHTSVRQFVSV